MKDFLEYLKIANEPVQKNSAPPLKIAVVTNFTDQVCNKILLGRCRDAGIFPEIYAVPFGQYNAALKIRESELAAWAADITFIFFDVQGAEISPFQMDADYGCQLITDIERYATENSGTIFINTIILPALTAHGNLRAENILYRAVAEFNTAVEKLAAEHKNIYVIDTNRLVQTVGEAAARDLRSLYAFHQPWSRQMIMEITGEWAAHVGALLGKSKKCIVLDLDNTLWGGVVGEVGATGIALGTEYPGNAFQNFQRVLLEYFDRGIILAINSRNNWSDVAEVFAQNPQMVLQEKHFAARAVNWNSKAENLVALAQELNIGLDSMVFFDDDAINRNLVRAQLPEVYVPEIGAKPEEYAATLLKLKVFHQLTLTAEDAARGRMYAQEAQHKQALAAAPSLEEYLAGLNIQLDFKVNDANSISRLAQLTQKTNQFNLTTRRYTEAEIENFICTGLVFSGNITDRFGDYGLTAEAIVIPENSAIAKLDAFLMSCRVLGRKIEFQFLAAVLQELKARGFQLLRAQFIPTAKNMPAAEFLEQAGFELISKTETGEKKYEIKII